MSGQSVTPILWGVGTVRTLRAHWVMHELGIDYECRPIRPRTPAMDRADFRAINPDCKVPALQYGDLTLVESTAIMLFLGETYAARAPGLIPQGAADRARFFEWMSFISTELDAASLYTIRRHHDLHEIYGLAPVAVKVAREYFLRMLCKPARQIQSGAPYLLGETFTLADILLVTCLRFADRMGVERPAGFDDYFQRLTGRPAFQAAMKANHT
ncbi:glutathione S-transferase family protein [Roseovarius sp. CAU 1744]|uniref:glutathione S-transferase family protein n=1 Tax=Roseovarius sp. CAU 1744 TaxID=3140368 RepID=UPI00325ADBA0